MVDRYFLILFVCLFTNIANASTIKIVSDKLEVISDDNISIFTGNVYALEEKIQIWSDKIVIKSNQNNSSIEEINAYNDVKIIRDEVTIIGSKAKYDINENKLFVFGNVKVTQNMNIILCDEIIVDLNSSSSIMKSDTARRVEALIVNVN